MQIGASECCSVVSIVIFGVLHGLDYDGLLMPHVQAAMPLRACVV